MTSKTIKERETLLRQLEKERKKLNEAIAIDLSSEESLACSRRVDKILEQLIDEQSVE